MYRYSISVPDSWIPDPEWQAAAAAARLHRIEFSCSASGAADAEGLARKVRILAEMKAAGNVDIGSVHIPFGPGWEFSSLDEAARLATVERVKRFLAACRPLSCRDFTMHGCLEPIRPEERAAGIEAFRRTLSDLLPTVRELGVSLNIEDLPRSCLGNTAEELAAMLDGFPVEQIGVCFDVNHLCGRPEAIPAGIALLAPRIRAFHISDYDGVDECHWYPGLGVIDWAAVMDEVRRLPNDVVLTFEVSGFLHAPEWQNRPIAHAIPFAAAVHNVFILENAAEIQRRKAELFIR